MNKNLSRSPSEKRILDPDKNSAIYAADNYGPSDDLDSSSRHLSFGSFYDAQQLGKAEIMMDNLVTMKNVIWRMKHEKRVTAENWFKKKKLPQKSLALFHQRQKSECSRTKVFMDTPHKKGKIVEGGSGGLVKKTENELPAIQGVLTSRNEKKGVIHLVKSGKTFYKGEGIASAAQLPRYDMTSQEYSAKLLLEKAKAKIKANLYNPLTQALQGRSNSLAKDWKTALPESSPHKKIIVRSRSKKSPSKE